MSFLKPLSPIKDEAKSNIDLEFSGIVEDNNDPLKLGRLKIRIDIWEDLPLEAIPWAAQKFPTFLGLTTKSIALSIPEIGSEVIVTFPTKDKYHPEYALSTINARNKCNFFDEDYPNSYGFKDSVGDFFKVNKVQQYMQIQHGSGTNTKIIKNGDITTTHVNGSYVTMFQTETQNQQGETETHNETKIFHKLGHYIDMTDDEIKIFHKSGSNINMNKDGDITATHTEGSFLKLDKDGKISAECKDFVANVENSVTFNCIEFNVNASSSVNLDTPSTNISGNANIGGNAGIGGSVIAGGSGTFGGDVVGGGISLDNHIHFAPHEAGNTSPPL